MWVDVCVCVSTIFSSPFTLWAPCVNCAILLQSSSFNLLPARFSLFPPILRSLLLFCSPADSECFGGVSSAHQHSSRHFSRGFKFNLPTQFHPSFHENTATVPCSMPYLCSTCRMHMMIKSNLKCHKLLAVRLSLFILFGSLWLIRMTQIAVVYRSAARFPCRAIWSSRHQFHFISNAIVRSHANRIEPNRDDRCGAYRVVLVALARRAAWRYFRIQCECGACTYVRRVAKLTWLHVVVLPAVRCLAEIRGTATREWRERHGEKSPRKSSRSFLDQFSVLENWHGLTWIHVTSRVLMN